MSEVAITRLEHDGEVLFESGDEVKESDFPKDVYEHFKENGAIGTPAQPTAAMEEENAKLREQLAKLKAELAAAAKSSTK